MAGTKRPSRRPLRREEGWSINARPREPVAVVTVVQRPVVNSNVALSLAALGAELAREKEARAHDADAMGEMLVRLSCAETERRSAETTAAALAARVRELEAVVAGPREAAAESESLESMRTELDALRGRPGARDALLEEQGERLATLEAEAAERKAQLNALAAMRDELVAHRRDLLAQLEESARETTHAERRVHELEEALRFARAEAERARLEIAAQIEHQARIRAAWDAHRDRDVEIERLRAESFSRLRATLLGEDAHEPAHVQNEPVPHRSPIVGPAVEPPRASSVAPSSQAAERLAPAPQSLLPEIPSFSEFAPPMPLVAGAAKEHPPRALRRSSHAKSTSSVPAAARRASGDVVATARDADGQDRDE